MKSKRTKALEIPEAVREAVHERDSGHCVWCKNNGVSNAHFIPRSKGGLGIEQNVLTLCPECHNKFDNGTGRNEMKMYFEEYLKSKYPGWSKSKLIYKKYDF